MALETEELLQLQKEITAKSPPDVLQFCANYFNLKLAVQRAQLWLAQPQARAAGLDIFPAVDVAVDAHGTAVVPSARQPLFKLPFGDNDPHLDHANGPFRGAPKAEPVEPKKKLPVQFNASRRVSVLAEAMNPDKFKLDLWKPPVNDLAPEQRAELARTLALNFLFRQLHSDAKATVVAALVKKTYQPGEHIITQGDVGDYFYIIEKGSVDIFVNGAKVAAQRDGDSFGELALMYNSPRAATVAATAPTTCWALDRATFRRILLEGTFNRRIMYEDFLRDVKILAGLSHQERSKIADALLTEIYHKGDRIITEGEKGEKFYLIESGSCEISKAAEGVVGTISKGGYFGEVALLKDVPRQATITALDTVIVATLGKLGFERLLGPALDALREQDPTTAHK